MKPIYLTYLNGPDIKELAMTNEEILNAIERALDAQGRGHTVIEPRVHLVLRDSADGHFNSWGMLVRVEVLIGIFVCSSASSILMRFACIPNVKRAAAH